MGLCLVVQTRPSCICLICDFCSSDREFALGLLQIPPHDGHPCPLLTLPTAKRVADFHRQVTAHFGQTKVTAPVLYRRGLLHLLFTQTSRLILYYRNNQLFIKGFLYGKFELFIMHCKVLFRYKLYSVYFAGQ